MSIASLLYGRISFISTSKAFANSPIWVIDPDGRDSIIVHMTKSNNNPALHAATYVGQDSQGNDYVLTKNGGNQLTVQKIDDIHIIISNGQKVTLLGGGKYEYGEPQSIGGGGTGFYNRIEW